MASHAHLCHSASASKVAVHRKQHDVTAASSCLFDNMPSQVAHPVLVQNAAPRLSIGTRKRGHISQILAALHWLPAKYNVDFMVMLVMVM